MKYLFISAFCTFVPFFGFVLKGLTTQRKCSDDQLNIVIDKVHECKKKNVICPYSEIERLIKEVCGK
jgi:hypothetical protein